MRVCDWMVSVGVGVVVLAAGAEAQAKAAYMNLAETVQTAEAIAVIHTDETEACEIAGEHWTYFQRVSASTRAVVKGTLTADLEILAEKSFVCGRVHYDAPADYLVFLHHDQEHWVTLNHGMGALSIDQAGNVDWPYGDGGRIPLGDALAEIRGMVGENAGAEIAMVEDGPLEDDVQDAEVDLEPELADLEPQPCGYLASYEAEQAEESFSLSAWLTHPMAMFGGGMAVFAGFVVGWRRRTRR